MQPTSFPHVALSLLLLSIHITDAAHFKIMYTQESIPVGCIPPAC